MQLIATDGVVWSVCRSVCYDREPSKNGWTDRDAVGIWTQKWILDKSQKI